MTPANERDAGHGQGDLNDDFDPVDARVVHAKGGGEQGCRETRRQRR
jgi:hypothetical protein